MTQPRDSQRAKVYRGEKEYSTAFGRRYIYDVWQIQKLVDHIVESAWWVERFPGVVAVEVKDGRGRRWAYGEHIGGGNGVIALPCACRCKMTILHELAHTVVPEDQPWHGGEFVQHYLALVDEWIGELEGAALRWFLVKNGVKWEKPA